MASDAAVVESPRLEREMASEAAVELYSYRGEDQHPSEILQTKSTNAQRLGELYDDMLQRDTDLAGLWEKRWKAVLGLPRYILPVNGTPTAQRTAEFCQVVLSDIETLHVNLRHQMESIIKGIAVDEIIWGRPASGAFAGSFIPQRIIDRPMWRFTFKQGELHVRQSGGQTVPAPPGKFLVMRSGTKDSPWGTSLLDKLYWPWWLKKHGWKYFAVYVEKWAQPTAVGKYRRGPDAQDNQKTASDLLGLVQKIQAEYAVAIPDDQVIELIEATRSGSVSYEGFITLCTRAMALILLGEIDTSGLAKGPGSYAKNRVSNEVRLETIRIDAHELSAHLTDNLLRPLVTLNFGSEAPVPKFVIEVEEAEDRELRQIGMAKVLDLGLPVPIEDLYRLHQVRLPRPDEDVYRLPSEPQSMEIVQ
jgi:phage gp29-like protein